VSIAGYGAWALGFIVGILPFLPVSEELKSMAQPAVVYSFITGFVVYAVLAKMGLQPETVPMGDLALGRKARA
jgi:cytosine permease